MNTLRYLRYYIVVEYDGELYRSLVGSEEKRVEMFGLEHTRYVGIHESLRQIK